MQYLSKSDDDLKSGYSTFVLQNTGKNINFFAYSGDTALNASKQGMKTNAYYGGRFLRKGFSEAIRSADPNIIEPSYEDLESNNVHPSSVDEAINLIYKNELTISGFRFKEGITDAQKEQALGKIVNSFVYASKNLDFSSDKNLFIVQSNGREVIYNNGGSESMQITGVDVQEKLGLKTKDVAIQQKYREAMQSRLR